MRREKIKNVCTHSTLLMISRHLYIKEEYDLLTFFSCWYREVKCRSLDRQGVDVEVKSMETNDATLSLHTLPDLTHGKTRRQEMKSYRFVKAGMKRSSTPEKTLSITVNAR